MVKWMFYGGQRPKYTSAKAIAFAQQVFLKSKTANIEDWTDSRNIFEGGGSIL